MVGLEHYARAMLGDAVFHRSLANTLVFTGAAVVLQTGSASCWPCSSRRPARQDAVPVVFFVPFVLAPVAVGTVWKFLYAPFFGVVATVGRRLGLDTLTVAPLADPTRRCGRSWSPSCGGSPASRWSCTSRPSRPSRASTTSTRVLEGAGRFQRFRRITWPLLWPQTFALVLLTTLGTLRIFDMVWVMTEGGPSTPPRRSPPTST